MTPPRRAIPLAVALVMAALAPARSAGPVFPAGSSVGLAPPAAMRPAVGFSGFQDKARGASIVVAEMPAEAYGQIVPRFSPEGLRPTGFAARGEAEDLPVAGGQARLMRGAQSAGGVAYAKWVVVVGGGSATAMITVQIPEAARAAIPDAAVEAALRTIVLRGPPAIADKIAALPFRIGDTAGLRPVTTMAGAGLYLTDGPLDVVKDGAQPMVIVAASVGKPPPAAERAAFARRALGELRQVTGVAIGEEQAEAAGGVTWIRSEATATDQSSGDPVTVAQVIRFEGKGYIRVLGMAKRSDGTIGARTRRLAASVTPR